MEYTDIFVIGGGPAGLAAAIAARQRGFNVTVADCAVPPIDKACGEGIMPDGVAAARALGISLHEAGSQPFLGIRFVEQGTTVGASFPRGLGLGIRRTTLHRLLLERAASAGIRTLWGTPIRQLRDLRARWIVGADGGHSRVRQWAGLEASSCENERYGFRRHYQVEPWSEYMELHWSDRCQLYVTPIAPREVCVALISNDPALRLDQALPLFPELAQRLRGASATHERGGISASRRLRHVVRDCVALVGDASGSVDAITGEGLCLLFQQSEALAAALEQGDLARYEVEHRRIARRAEWMARGLLLLAGNRWLRRRAFHAFDSRPQLFERLLAMHLGELAPVPSLLNGLAFGWKLLTA